MTPDHVNPEAPWPQLDASARATAAAGKVLVERLAVYPRLCARRRRAGSTRRCARRCCARATPRASRAPTTGSPGAGSRRRRGPPCPRAAAPSPRRLARRSSTARSAARPWRSARSSRCSRRAATDFDAVCDAADGCAARSTATRVSYVVNRNINYTNICSYRCGFCAFSKGKLSENLRGRPYDLDLEEIRAGAARKPGSAARPKSACRAASIRTTPARPISTSAAR